MLYSELLCYTVLCMVHDSIIPQLRCLQAEGLSPTNYIQIVVYGSIAAGQWVIWPWENPTTAWKSSGVGGSFIVVWYYSSILLYLRFESIKWWVQCTYSTSSDNVKWNSNIPSCYSLLLLFSNAMSIYSICKALHSHNPSLVITAWEYYATCSLSHVNCHYYMENIVSSPNYILQCFSVLSQACNYTQLWTRHKNPHTPTNCIFFATTANTDSVCTVA